ncbi:MAG: ester cyclase [Dehalococcoidales bacterium]|nr:ester cyclase [Dehalococcoidales bacterium]
MSDEFSGNEGAITSKEDHKKYWDNMRTTMPDLQLEITDIMSEGDRVIALQKWTAHVSLKNNHPSNGKYVESSNATLYELKNGKIVKGGSLTNIILPLLQQFGIIPPLEELTKSLTQYL